MFDDEPTFEDVYEQYETIGKQVFCVFGII